MALYSVPEPHLSPSDVLGRITAGLTDLKPWEGGFEGGFMILFTVPDEFAEIVEEAASRNGIGLIRIPDDQAPDGLEP